MVSVGPLELVFVLIVALVVLGPRRLPETARSLGTGLREMRAALAASDEPPVPEEAPEPPARPAAHDADATQARLARAIARDELRSCGPELVLELRTRGAREPAIVDLRSAPDGAAAPRVVVTTDAEPAHRFWLGGLYAPLRLLTGGLAIAGPARCAPAALRALPLISAAYRAAGDTSPDEPDAPLAALAHEPTLPERALERLPAQIGAEAADRAALAALALVAMPPVERSMAASAIGASRAAGSVPDAALHALVATLVGLVPPRPARVEPPAVVPIPDAVPPAAGTLAATLAGSLRRAEVRALLAAIGEVEWRLVDAGAVSLTTLDAASGTISTATPAHDAAVTVRLEGDAALDAPAAVAAALAEGRLSLSGRVHDALALSLALPAVLGSAPAPRLPRAALPPAHEFPARLQGSPIDDMLLLAAFLAALAERDRREAVERVAEILGAADGVAAERLPRLLTSCGDLAAGASNHTFERAELEENERSRLAQLRSGTDASAGREPVAVATGNV
jgi:sec-independent protein translocase protein TatA